MTNLWQEFIIEFNNNPIGMIGMIVLIIGIFLFTIPSIIFRWRAITNKKAWGGKTLPTLKFAAFIFIIGLLLFIAGLVLN